MAKVLILEQSDSMRNCLRERLEYEGYTTEGVDCAERAVQMCEKIPFDVILSDDAKGLTATKVPLIVLSANNTVESAVDALHHGAVDFLTKPINMNRLLEAVRRNVRSHNVAPAPEPSRPLRKSGANGCCDEPMIGQSEGIVRIHSLVDKVAPSEARVLIVGENGTGKELVARMLHRQSARANKPFVEVNCAAIPSELIESELFGHEKGAFTSAVKQRRGKFEQADGGTLFMDEIGDMSLAAQAKVLRALQEHKISRVGSDGDIKVDVRVIAATNKNLREEIRKGNFREDLYHRIAVIVIELPPLREREGDVPLLTEYFLGRLCAENRIAPKSIDADALTALSQMEWSGNVRELRNAIERLVILSDRRITLDDVRHYCP